jgi:hypothetical protein
MPIYDDHVTVHNADLGATTTVRRGALKSLRRRGWVEVTADKVSSVDPPANNAGLGEWSAYAKRLGLDVAHLKGRNAIRDAALVAEQAAKISGQPAGTTSPEGDTPNIPSKED